VTHILQYFLAHYSSFTTTAFENNNNNTNNKNNIKSSTKQQQQPLLRTGILYSTSKKANAMFSMTPLQSTETISSFDNGEINLLIATAVAEEGMDIPDANCVIRFDPPISTVALVQSRGF
jgi:RecG-like helicase